MMTTVIGLKIESSMFIRMMTNAADYPGEIRISSLSSEKCFKVSKNI